jgi:hypothetical protein
MKVSTIWTMPAGTIFPVFVAKVRYETNTVRGFTPRTIENNEQLCELLKDYGLYTSKCDLFVNDTKLINNEL